MTYDDYAALLETTVAERDEASRSDYRTGFQPENIDDLLSATREAERTRVESALAEVNEQLETRDAIHNNQQQDLERALEQYEDRLRQLIRQCASRDRQARQRTRIRELTQVLQQERRQQWRDRQDLLGERRDLQRELAELTDQSRLQFR